MKRFLIAALPAAVCAFAAATSASAQQTVTGAPKGTEPATVEGYGPTSVIVCNHAGSCWHALQRYDYPAAAGVVVHPYTWRWNNGARFAWREHKGRGYWQGDEWRTF
jgi:opacity protein-like surface antigen